MNTTYAQAYGTANISPSFLAGVASFSTTILPSKNTKHNISIPREVLDTLSFFSAILDTLLSNVFNTDKEDAQSVEVEFLKIKEATIKSTNELSKFKLKAKAAEIELLDALESILTKITRYASIIIKIANRPDVDEDSLEYSSFLCKLAEEDDGMPLIRIDRNNLDALFED